jgi:hypothetical protein
VGAALELVHVGRTSADVGVCGRHSCCRIQPNGMPLQQVAVSGWPRIARGALPAVAAPATAGAAGASDARVVAAAASCQRGGLGLLSAQLGRLL